MSQKFSYDQDDEKLTPKQEIELFHSIENDIDKLNIVLYDFDVC